MKKLLALSLPLSFCCAGLGLAAEESSCEISPMARSGCWAVLYDDTGFAGRSITIAGETRIRELDDFSDSLGWAENSLTSVQIGPHASLLVHEGDQFTGKRYRLNASKSFTNLKQSVPMNIESLSLSCVD